MKQFAIFCLLLAGHSIFAQQVLFEKSIPEQALPGIHKVSEVMGEFYLQTRYAYQEEFLKPQDLEIRLSAEKMVMVRFQRMYHYPNGAYSYVGRLEGTEGEVSFSRYKDKIAGMVVLEDGSKYMIDQTGPGLFAISLSNESIFITREKATDHVLPRDEPTPSDPLVLSTGSLCGTESLCLNPSEIDLMVVFTQSAENGWGGFNNTIANLTQAVTNMNTSMTNTGVNNVTYRLVHAAKVSYAESGNMSTDLSRLRSTTDGIMDEIHGWRTQYGADMVSLIVGSASSGCGVGYLNSSPTAYSASNAFNVTLRSCAVGNYTMAHEFGHNMGLHHDWYVSSSTTPCAHHHGYVNQAAITLGTSSTSSQRWRTIMAYNDHCSSVGISCTRLNRWSNPAINYNGNPTGRDIGTTNPADEATAFSRMACRVAALVSTAPSCAAPIGLSTGNITTTSATISWSPVSGASSYRVEYKEATSSTWINIASSTTSTSASLTSLTINTTYDWRVRTNCASSSSAFTQAQFSTLAACATPGSLNTTNITTNSATISWNEVPEAQHYDVDYKLNSSQTWTNAVTATTQLSTSLENLTPSTAYNWRVRATCPLGTGNDALSNFSTSALPVCNDLNEPNNTSKQGKAINLGTVINAAISSASDVDWYKFTSPNSSATNIRVTVYDLPANYDAFLYDRNIAELRRSTNTGTTTEVIVYNNTIKRNNYNLLVSGVGGSFDPSTCYKVLVESSATPYPLPDQSLTSGDAGLNAENNHWNIFPVPAKDMVNIIVFSETSSNAQISLMDISGRQLQGQAVKVSTGTNMFTFRTVGYNHGLYLIRLQMNGSTYTKKAIIQP